MSDSDIFCLDEDYSTTRLVTYQKPVIQNSPEDKFKGVLFLPQSEGRQGEGGLRKQGYFKKGTSDKPLITVITVVFNGAEFLEETIQSVINQTYDNVEYIIIDGGSTDGTLDIIKKYEGQIDYWVSEKDGGIFSAMNKGASCASGSYVYYINSGDSLVSNRVFESVCKKIISVGFSKYKLFVGQVMLTYQNNDFGLFVIKGKSIPHQSVFLKRSVFGKIRFDDSLSIFGDSDLWNRMCDLGIFSVIELDVLICRFPMNGIGSSPEFIWSRFHDSAGIFVRNKKYFSYTQRFILSLSGYIFYKLFGERMYFYLYVRSLNYLLKYKR
jgi:glycosyltransferase involved in cell wall biosynthesis